MTAPADLSDAVKRLASVDPEAFSDLLASLKLAAALERLAEAIWMVEHDMDWDLSADSHIEDDAEFEEAAMDLLRAALEVPDGEQA